MYFIAKNNSKLIWSPVPDVACWIPYSKLWHDKESIFNPDAFFYCDYELLPFVFFWNHIYHRDTESPHEWPSHGSSENFFELPYSHIDRIDSEYLHVQISYAISELASFLFCNRINHKYTENLHASASCVFLN